MFFISEKKQKSPNKPMKIGLYSNEIRTTITPPVETTIYFLNIGLNAYSTNESL